MHNLLPASVRGPVCPAVFASESGLSREVSGGPARRTWPDPYPANPNRAGWRPMMIAATTLGTYLHVSSGSARVR